MEEDFSRWAKMTKTYLKQVNLTLEGVSTMGKEEIKKYMKKWDEERWKEEMKNKTDIKIYRKHKQHIEEDPIL